MFTAMVRLTQTLHDACRLAGKEDFHTVMPAPALLGKEATYWQSVHQAGQGLMKERQEAVKKAKDAWQAKVTAICLFAVVLHLQPCDKLLVSVSCLGS